MSLERINITGIGSELQGVGHLADGRAVFVPGALPGEEVEVEITRESARFCEARLERVVAASPDRTKENCIYSDRCGGCVARHMRYEATLRLKRQRVADALERIGGIEHPTVFETVGCAAPERCRNKAEYAVEYRNGALRVGCLEARSHRVLSVDDCLLQRPESVRALNWAARRLGDCSFAPHIRYLVTRVNRAGELMVILSGNMQLEPVAAQTSSPNRNRAKRGGGKPGGERRERVVSRRSGAASSTVLDEHAALSGARLREELRALAEAMRKELPELISFHYCQLGPHPAHALDGRCFCVFGAETMTDTLLGLRFELSPQSFFQVDPEQAERLYQLALEAAGLGDAVTDAQKNGCAMCDPNSPRILDAYCGAGTITLAAAARGASCVGVEIVAPAIENARRNALRNGLSERVRFLCGDAAREIPKLIRQGERFDAAILDPPRKGADAALLHALADADIQRIAYVSCDPATLARDVRLLIERGYTCRSAQPLDMFPWTGHVETVCRLIR